SRPAPTRVYSTLSGFQIRGAVENPGWRQGLAGLVQGLPWAGECVPFRDKKGSFQNLARTSGGTFRFPNRLTELIGPGSCPSLEGGSFSYTAAPSDSGVMLLETPEGGDCTIRFKDGSQEVHSSSGAPLRRVGPNGNILEAITDTLGRQYGSDAGSVSYRDSEGQLRSASWSSEFMTLNLPDFISDPCGPFDFPVIVPTSAMMSAVTSLTTPTGLEFTFQYDPANGELTRIGLPGGGAVTYEYMTFPRFDQPPPDWPCELDSRRVVKRTVSADWQ
ncbi:MAG: hypothetical protein V3T83_07705, partial [Acidobacteriota bacterium]